MTAPSIAAVGYNWTKSIATTVGYRVLYAYNRQSTGGNSSFRFQQWLSGPYAAIKYGF